MKKSGEYFITHARFCEYTGVSKSSSLNSIADTANSVGSLLSIQGRLSSHYNIIHGILHNRRSLKSRIIIPARDMLMARDFTKPILFMIYEDENYKISYNVNCRD